MAEKYRRIRKVLEKLPDNEIRVRKDNAIGKYLRRANDIFSGKVQGFDTVVIKGVANAMENAVKLAELIKHRVGGLYQLNEIKTIEITDEFEPLEEGLDYLTFSRNSTMLSITLSKTELDNRNIGYQDPIP
jgi:ribonuclease P/MRP protein subunit RPP25